MYVKLPMTLAMLVLACACERQPEEAPVLASIIVEPAVALASPGGIVRLAATAYDERGRVLETAFHWSSSDSTVAAVSAAGVVSARRPGTVAIHATSGATAGIVGFSVLGANPLLSSGAGHTCALAGNGAVYCWGLGESGQLGNLGTSDRATPSGVTGGLTLAAVSSGNQQSCALTVAGEAYCWGTGLLGNGTTPTLKRYPVAVAGGIVFASISASQAGGHTCALTPAGEAYCWGSGGEGQLGNGSLADRLAPEPVAGALRFTAISAGASHTCALIYTGQVYCWGSGFLSTGERFASPVLTGDTLALAAVSAGNGKTCGLTTRGLVWCLSGLDQPHSYLGIGSIELRSISMGAQICGLAKGGDAYCWSYGQEPQLVAGGHRFTHITAGGSVTCARQDPTHLYCWGSGSHGALGNGLFEGSRSEPELVTTNVTFASPVSPLRH